MSVNHSLISLTVEKCDIHDFHSIDVVTRFRLCRYVTHLFFSQINCTNFFFFVVYFIVISRIFFISYVPIIRQIYSVHIFIYTFTYILLYTATPRIRLWFPSRKQTISNIKNQRTFTKIKGMTNIDYWERLEVLKQYSLQFRRERYVILTTWRVNNQRCPHVLNITSKFIQG